LHLTHMEIAIGYIVKNKSSGQRSQTDRKHRRLDNGFKNILHGSSVLLHRSKNLEVRAFAKSRKKKRQTLYVIPMHVREQAMTFEWTCRRNLVSAITQPSSEIKN